MTGLQAGLKILDSPGAVVRKGIGWAIGAKPKAGERTA